MDQYVSAVLGHRAAGYYGPEAKDIMGYTTAIMILSGPIFILASFLPM
jgi:short subunit fatty acids transporter